MVGKALYSQAEKVAHLTVVIVLGTRAVKKVPGRKNMVSTTMAFIAEESRLLSRAISLLCSDMR